MSRKDNKKNNSSLRSAKFLKRDSDVGLFMFDDKTKIRLHQDVIESSLSAIDKGAIFTIHDSLINETSLVVSKRCIVTNPKQKEINGQSMDYHTMSGQIFAIRDKECYFLPIGTRYYWMGMEDIPTIGSCVLFTDWNKDEHKVVLVKKISEYHRGTLYGIVLSLNGIPSSKDVEFADLESFDIKRCMFTLVSKDEQMGAGTAIQMLNP